MNEFTTLCTAPGQRSGEVPLSAVQHIERAGARVIVHLRGGGQCLLDEAYTFEQLARLSAWVSLDGCRLIRRATIMRLGPVDMQGLLPVLLDSGEVVFAAVSHHLALVTAWADNIEQRLGLGDLPAWPQPLPAPPPPPLTDYVAESNELRDLQARCWVRRFRPGSCA